MSNRLLLTVTIGTNVSNRLLLRVTIVSNRTKCDTNVSNRLLQMCQIELLFDTIVSNRTNVTQMCQIDNYESYYWNNCVK